MQFSGPETGEGKRSRGDWGTLEFQVSRGHSLSFLGLLSQNTIHRLKQEIFFFPGGQKSEIEGHTPSRGCSRGECVSCPRLVPGGCWFPRFVATPLQSLPLWSHSLPLVCLSLVFPRNSLAGTLTLPSGPPGESRMMSSSQNAE